MNTSESITDLIEVKVYAQDFKLPVFNRVALELQQSITSGISMEQAEKLILKDQAIASEILKLANSAFFSGLAKIESIQQALVRLGVEMVLSIIMLVSQKQAFQAKSVFIHSVMQELWQHASVSAGGCRWMAINCGHTVLKEKAFLAGLLHDLGSLVLLKVLDELLQEKSDLPMTEAVIHELIATLHMDYGYQVMHSWGFPKIYCSIARDHHKESQDENNILLHIVRLVDAACIKLSIGMDTNPDMVLELLPEAQVLGMKAIQLAELEVQLEDLLAQLT
ncbi:HDOD domain-containing protein [Spartinivicinus poritis]|uniref:HDOD domain-containing protein n=1 Tax=Spartinivicinus poritis TaxID=2994640 RepID=A0ABT5UHD4_9GAMM|nr:HDOD domain-containing protein [Spartinivicinus sp. A2-2]MDE1465813.1 HDOD domain-containing protein [Spartinivicinus sp. A2-2]